RTQVADLNVRAVERAPAVNGRVVLVLHSHVRAHAGQLREPVQAILEHGLFDVRDPGRLAEQDAERWLEVGRKPGVGRRSDVAGAVATALEARPVDVDRIAV